MIPEAGGEYAYLRRGFGPVWGFLFGWMHSIVGRPASASSIAAGVVGLLGGLLRQGGVAGFRLADARPVRISVGAACHLCVVSGVPLARGDRSSGTGGEDVRG